MRLAAAEQLHAILMGRDLPWPELVDRAEADCHLALSERPPKGGENTHVASVNTLCKPTLRWYH